MKYFVSIIFAVCVLATSSANATIVYGYAYLEGETNHSGTIVEFYKYPNFLCNDDITNSSGYYQVGVVSGWYYVRYLHYPGYITLGIDSVFIPSQFSYELPPVTLRPISCEGLGWHEYPYNPPGTNIDFPEDEGKHNPLTTYPIEWWYANFHLTGEATGEDYGAFIAFFKQPMMRLFAISDLDEQQYYSHAKLAGILVSSTTELDLHYTDELFNADQWWNIYHCNAPNNFAPFQYRIVADATADQDGERIALDLVLVSEKAPMMVGGDGYVSIGSGWSRYYSHTRLEVTGAIEVHGVKEYVTGYAWIDHQWGNFLLGETVRWEWFSIQLDDEREIMVADAWVDGHPAGSFSGGLNYYNDDCTLEILEDYTITPLDHWTDSVSGTPFAKQWRIEETSRDIDLVVTAEFEDQVMRSILSDIFPGAIFWEGVCGVAGSIDGDSVSGKAYAELTHPRAVLDTGGTLCTVIPPDIGDTRLRLMLDQYLPAVDVHSSLFVLTECYGGDVMDNLADRANTAVLSGTSPCQVAYWCGYDDDAAMCLYPSPGRTSDDVHACGVSGKHEFENPQKLGVTLSLEPTSPSGPIKGRHILFYAGIPDGHDYELACSDTAYLRVIKDSFSGEYNTTVYAVGGTSLTQGFDYWGAGFGLRNALKDIHAEIDPDEQFIMFVSDHGGKRLVPNLTQCVCGKGNCEVTVPYFIPQSTWEEMQEDTNNVPRIVITGEECYAAACSVEYCGKTYYPVYFDCSDTIEVEVNGAPAIGWAAMVEVNEDDICPDGDIIRVSSPDCLELVEISLESGAIDRQITCVPGDADGSGEVDIDDVVYLINYIFAGGPAPVPYPCCGDANGDGSDDACGVDIDDVVYLIQYIFGGGPPPRDGCAFCGLET